MCRKAMAYVAQADEAVVAVHIQRQNPCGPDVETRKRQQNVPQQTRPAECWPGDRALICACFGAVALERLAPAVEAQCDS